MFFWAKAAAARSRRGRASSAGAEFEDILSKARELADSIPCGEREWRGRRFEFCFDSLSAVHALCSGQRHNRSPTDAVQLLQEMLLFGLIERVSKRKDEYTGQTRIHTTSIKVSSHTYYRFNMRKIAERNLVVKVVDAGEDATIVLALAGQAHMVSVGDTCVFGFHQMYPTLSLSVEEATTGTAVASRDMEVKVVENLSTTSDEDKLEALRVDDLSTFDADRDVQARTYRLDSTSSNNVSLAVFAKVNEMDEFASTEGNFETRTWRVCVHIDQVRGAQSRISRLLPGKVVIECGAKVVWLENNHALKIPTVNKEDDRFTSPRQKSRQTKGANFDGERLVVVAAAPRQHAVLRVSVYERLKTDLTRTRRLGVATIPLSDVPISEEPVDEDDDNEDGHRLPKKRTLQLRTGSGSKNGLVVCSVSMMPLLTEDFPADLSARFGFGLRAAVAFLAVLFVLLCALLPRGFLDATLCYSPLLAIVLYVQSPTICASVSAAGKLL